MMKEIRINENVKIVCRTHKSKTGFKHIAEFYRNGEKINSRSKSYYNRTWEEFNYQTVIENLLEKMVKKKQITPDRAEEVMDIVSSKAKADVKARFGSVASLMAMGDVLNSGKSKKERNKAKVRMLKASFGDALNLPSYWESLSEDEKEKRLKKVAEHLKT